MAITAAILIAAYIIGLIVVLMWPQKQHHPEDGMAIGCLMMVIACLVLLGLVLGLAVWLKLAWLQWAIGVLTIAPLVIGAPQLAWLGTKHLRSRAIAKGNVIPPEQLHSRLSGRTHVFRYGIGNPPVVHTELRYYAADGRVAQYEEKEDGRIVPFPGEITWTTEDGLLVTLNDIRPGNRNRYQIRDLPDGQIGYYIHAPWTRINGKMSRRTTQIREGEPAVTT